MPYIATCDLESGSEYSQSRMHEVPKVHDKESPADYDTRTWREKAHYDPKTKRVFIPALQFKFAIAEAARFLSEKIPGKGQEKWTKHFQSGVIVQENLELPLTVDQLECVRVQCNPKGIRGNGSRVPRTFPVIRRWRGKVRFAILDDLITEDVFTRVLREAGKLIGIGRGRIGNGGYYNGTFTVHGVDWQEYRL